MHAREYRAAGDRGRPSSSAFGSQRCAPSTQLSQSAFNLPVASVDVMEKSTVREAVRSINQCRGKLQPPLTFKPPLLIWILLCQRLGNAVLARCYFWQWTYAGVSQPGGGGVIGGRTPHAALLGQK